MVYILQCPAILISMSQPLHVYEVLNRIGRYIMGYSNNIMTPWIESLVALI